MNKEAIFVLVALVGMIVVLAYDKMRPGLTFFSIVVLFMLTGIITPSEAVAGFSNKGMITVAVLFLVSEGLRQSGALNALTSKILPTRRVNVPRALARMLPSIAGISAFLNNTAVVIIFAPIVKKWSEVVNLPSTKFLIPLSYATILGGICTLIGTSTNLVVHGMMIENGFKGFGMFDLAAIGIPIAVVGISYIIIFGNMLLPGERISRKFQTDEAGKEIFKEYYYEIYIPEGSQFIGKRVRDSQVEGFPQVSIIHVKRGEELIPGTKRIRLELGDELTLAGKSSTMQRLLSAPGVKLCCLNNADINFITKAQKQVEAVLGPRFPGIKKSLGEFDFFRHYGAVVMAIHRNGERITTGLDSIILQEGDNLVLLTDGSFISTWGESKVFYLLSDMGDFEAPSSKKKRWFAFGLTAFMIIGATVGDFIPSESGASYDMLFFASIVMVIMAWTKMFPAKKYTKYVSWDILIAIACAFAISKAMQNSGIADIIATQIINVSSALGPYAILAALFLITNIFTEIITNNAAAALSFPIALSVSEQLGVNPYPFFVIICVAASASFSTPIGYQTNLIVQSIGNYKFRDYLKVGLPLNIITFLLSVFLIPLIWKF